MQSSKKLIVTEEVPNLGNDTPFMLDGSFCQKKTHEGFITSELTLLKVSKETLEQILRSRNTMHKLKLFINLKL